MNEKEIKQNREYKICGKKFAERAKVLFPRTKEGNNTLKALIRFVQKQTIQKCQEEMRKILQHMKRLNYVGIFKEDLEKALINLQKANGDEEEGGK